jgi:hypothetical protein
LLLHLFRKNTGKLRRRAWAKLVGLSNMDRTGSEEEDSPEDLLDTFSQYEYQIRRLEHSFNEGEEKKREELLDRDLIRRDAGRSVLFRYRTPNNHSSTNNNSSSNPLDPPAASEDYPTSSNDSVATPTGQSSKGETDGAKLAPDGASDLLARVLETTIANPLADCKLYYYQGLHDVAGILLHALEYDTDAAIQILRRLCQSHLRDALRENFGNIMWLLSVLLLPLVEQLDPMVHYALLVSEVELSNVCLPWVITWFSHDMHNPAVASRFVDAFVSSHPLLPLYVTVALLTHPLLKQDIISTGEMGDPASMFVAIKGLTKSIVADDATTNVEDGMPTVSAQEIIEDAIAIMYVAVVEKNFWWAYYTSSTNLFFLILYY